MGLQHRINNARSVERQQELMRETIGEFKAGNYELLRRVEEFVRRYSFRTLYENYGITTEEYARWLGE